MPSKTSSNHHIYGFMNYRKSIYESAERYDALLGRIIYAQKQGKSDEHIIRELSPGAQEKELRSLIMGVKQAKSMKPLTAWRNLLMMVLGALMLHQLFILAGWLPGVMFSAIVFFIIYIVTFDLVRREVPWAYVMSGYVLLIGLLQTFYGTYIPGAGHFNILPAALYPYGVILGLIASYKLYTERPMQAVAVEQAKRRLEANGASTGNLTKLNPVS